MKKIAFVWDNFGPMHVDRCEAVARHFGAQAEIIGIELGGKSATYAWNSDAGKSFQKVTLFPNQKIEAISTVRRAWSTVAACLRSGAGDIFFCHYEHPATFLSATMLRLAGRRAYVIGCSKFDDVKRHLRREVIKRLFYAPYRGGIGSRRRSTDYMEFLGLPAERVEGGYNTLSLERIRRAAGAPRAPNGTPFSERHFTVIARFVPKKNLAIILDAYHLYRNAVTRPHKLQFLGSGPLEETLRTQADQLGLSDSVSFHGFQQAPEIARRLATSLALLLPSVEEQFGNVVIEAQAMGVPVILSDNCGARDELIRTAVNGFVVEPDNPEGFAFFMRLISQDEALWTQMCQASERFVDRGDAARFAESVERLVEDR